MPSTVKNNALAYKNHDSLEMLNTGKGANLRLGHTITSSAGDPHILHEEQPDIESQCIVNIGESNLNNNRHRMKSMQTSRLSKKHFRESGPLMEAEEILQKCHKLQKQNIKMLKPIAGLRKQKKNMYKPFKRYIDKIDE